MADTYTKEQYDELVRRLEKTEGALKDASEKNISKEIDTLKSTIKDLETAKAALSTELTAAQAVARAHEDKSKALDTELTKVKYELSKANDVISASQKEAVKAKRLAMFNDIDIDAVKALELVNQLVDATDAVFDTLVKAMPKKKAAEAVVTPTTPAAALATATVDPTVGPITPPNVSDENRAAASLWFSNIFKSTEKVKGE